MYKNRSEAGELLAAKLKEQLGAVDPANAIVMTIPRGGVVIGRQVSNVLGYPVDSLIIKKIPAPNEEELAIGAIGEGGVVVWEEELCQRLGVTAEYKQEKVKEKVSELERKMSDFRGDKPLPMLKGKTVIIADDGVATGATIKVAINVVKNFAPQEIVVAVPVIAPDSLEEIKKLADRIVYLEAPEMFFSVGQFYENFDQISDEEAREILR